MKKIIGIFVTLCIISTFAGACGNTTTVKEETSSVSETNSSEKEVDQGEDELQLQETETEETDPEDVTEFKNFVTDLLEKDLSVEDAGDIIKAEELYENLSEDNKAIVGEEWITKLGLLRDRLDVVIYNIYDNQVLTGLEEFNMFKAHEGVESVKDYANEQETELLSRADEVIQSVCYPKTLIITQPHVSAYKNSALITSTTEETDDYALYTYVYNNRASKDKSKLDGNGFDNGFCQYIENAFTTTKASTEENKYAQNLKENLPDGIPTFNTYSVWLQETGDFIAFGGMSSSIARTINGINVGRNSDYPSYESISILIIYGDYELEYMPAPKVSAFAETEEPDSVESQNETEEKTIADFKNDHANAEKTKPSTSGEENSLKKAMEYIQVMAFSYNGLVEQLEYEGFSHSEAVYGADNCGADWNEQAVRKAKQYLEYMSFSKSGLIDQLIFDGFTEEQAEYGVSKAY